MNLQVKDRQRIILTLWLLVLFQWSCAENTGNQVSNIKTPTTVKAPTVTPTATPATTPTPSQTPEALTINDKLIAPIKDETLADGCGCYFQTLAESKKQYSGKYLFFADVDDEAVMNLAGKDIKLKSISRSGDLETIKKGVKSTIVYGNGPFTVTLDRVITSVCAPNDESCEFTGYDATITVQNGKEKQVIKSTGGCGC
jgi:hypothetical protein